MLCQVLCQPESRSLLHPIPKSKFEKECDDLYIALESKHSFSLEALRYEDGSEFSAEDSRFINSRGDRGAKVRKSRRFS